MIFLSFYELVGIVVAVEETLAVQSVFLCIFPVQNNHFEVGFAKKVSC
jgi:hypothetical protein